MKHLIWVAVTAYALLTGCSDHHKAAGEFYALPAERLAYTDSIGFTLFSLDSTAARRLYVAVSHSDDYPYSNLWLEVTYRDSAECVRDTVGLTLADRYGKWQGHGIGTSYQVEAQACDGVNPKDGSHVTIRHVMRADTLKGITRIGVIAK